MIFSIATGLWNFTFSSFSGLTQCTFYTFVNKDINKFTFKIKYIHQIFKRKPAVFPSICIFVDVLQSKKVRVEWSWTYWLVAKWEHIQWVTIGLLTKKYPQSILHIWLVLLLGNFGKGWVMQNFAQY